MAAPERFADMSDSSCTAGAVHTWQNKAKEAKARFAAAAAKQADKYANMSLQEAAKRVRELLRLDDPPKSAPAATACRPP
jgi:hypothetical protein